MEVIVWFLLRAATMAAVIATSASIDTLLLEDLNGCGCITVVHIFWICCVGGGRDIAFQPLRAISFDDDYSVTKILKIDVVMMRLDISA